MGDHFQAIVDRDITVAAAETRGPEIVSWLVELGVIESGQTDCALGNPTGYPPGPNYRTVVDVDASDDDHTLQLRTNGMEVVIGRTVFHNGQLGLALVCRKCGERIEGGDAWSNAVGKWYEGSGEGKLACPNCGNAEPVTEWPYDPPWGFGNLGFRFWNWPELKPSFIAEFSQRLGHRTVYVYGKL